MGNANCSIEKHEILLEQGFFSRIENLQFFKEDARGSEEDEGCEKLLGKCTLWSFYLAAVCLLLRSFSETQKLI